jgi:hypothetical protein
VRGQQSQESIPLLTYESRCGWWRWPDTPQSMPRCAPSGPLSDDTSSGTRQRYARLATGDPFFDWSAARVLRLPDPLRELRPDPTFAQRLPQGFRIVAFIRRDHLEPFARAIPLARVHLDCIKQRHHLGALIPIGRRSAIGQRHPVVLHEAVDQNAFAFPPRAMPAPPPLPERRMRHPTATLLRGGGKTSSSKRHSKSLKPSNLPAITAPLRLNRTV